LIRKNTEEMQFMTEIYAGQILRRKFLKINQVVGPKQVGVTVVTSNALTPIQ
jgi:hypothetical protein